MEKKEPIRSKTPSTSPFGNTEFSVSPTMLRSNISGSLQTSVEEVSVFAALIKENAAINNTLDKNVTSKGASLHMFKPNPTGRVLSGDNDSDFASKMLVESLTASTKSRSLNPLLMSVFNESNQQNIDIIENKKKNKNMNMAENVEMNATHKISNSISTFQRFKWPTLGELYNHLFGKEPEGLHNSMMDVLVCLRSFMKMRYEYDCNCI